MAPSQDSGLLSTWFPHTTTPFIANAPMLLAATAPLAVAVSKAGGLGFIGAGFDVSPSSPQLSNLDKELTAVRSLLLLNEADSVLPIGIGFLTFHSSISQFEDTVTPLIQKHKPSGVWLFAPADGAVHGPIITLLKELGKAWNLKIFVQVGTVAAAREATRQGCDVIVAQGVEAGGHQWAQSSGISTLVPEVRDMLDKEFSDKKIALLSAGGICDGRGVAASLCLGADGVVMGTRFLCTEESAGSEAVKQKVVNAKDGGIATAKSFVYDDVIFDLMNVPEVRFPYLYDGRAIKEDWIDSDPEEAKKKFKAANANSPTTVYWAGTGVGLIEDVRTASDVLQKAQTDCRALIQRLRV